MITVLITGGTGLIGRAITKALLKKNYHVIILSRTTRNSKAETPNLSYALWDVNKQTIDEEAISKADYIIHLAGAGIADKRWTKKRKQEIVDSRVQGSELIVKALEEIPNKIKAIISSSAIGWYGPDPAIPNPDPFTEEYPAHDDFLGNTCHQWEKSIEPVSDLRKRLVKFRTGVVLSNEGGALKEFKRPLFFGVAAILGTGKQMISWININDLANLYVSALENENMVGVYNAVAPYPVSNRKLTLQLARTIKGKFFIPFRVPAFVLKFLYGELSIEVLKSATISCNKIQSSGFSFLFPTVDSALKNLREQD